MPWYGGCHSKSVHGVVPAARAFPIMAAQVGNDRGRHEHGVSGIQTTVKRNKVRAMVGNVRAVHRLYVNNKLIKQLARSGERYNALETTTQLSLLEHPPPEAAPHGHFMSTK